MIEQEQMDEPITDMTNSDISQYELKFRQLTEYLST